MNSFSRQTALLQALLIAAAASAYAAPSAPPAPDASAATATSQAPTGPGASIGKKGELGTQEIKGVSKEKLDVGKFDPPAAFNLEDIQNFPEDRLLPVLNNPLTFEEGRDFPAMMDFQREELYHPWLPEIAKAPFLTMKTEVDKPPKEWTFSIIDQAGSPVAKQDGKGVPPATLSWNGEDGVRGYVAVDTVYIPQLATTDKEGYHHTYMGQPFQFSSIQYTDHGHTVVEVSSKRLFQEKKSDWSKEAPVLLDKVADALREQGQRSFTIQPYDSDAELGRERQTAMKDYLVAQLHVAPDQVSTPEPQGADKRGEAMAVLMGGAR